MADSNISIRKAALINGIAKYYGVVCSLIINSILSRILNAEEYGIVAMITVFITFFSIFSDMGFGAAYIQNRDLDQEDRDDIFSFLVYTGIILFILFYFFSYVIAWFYNDDVYLRVSQTLGVVLFLNAVNVIPYSDLLKKHEFIKAGSIQMLSISLSSIAALILGKIGFSYYAIVFQSIINLLFQVIAFVILAKVRFKVRFHMTSIRKVAGFSAGQLTFNIINYFSRNIDNLLIGKFFGNQQLGYYDKAYKTSTYPISNFSSIIGSSIHPVLSKKQNDKEGIYDTFRKVFLFLVIVGGFISVFLSLSSKEVIRILYGNHWDESILPFSYLALSLYAQMSLNIVGPFYQVLNNTKLLAVSGLISSFLLVGGILIGMSFKTIKMVACCYLIAQSINFIVTIYIMENHLFQISMKGLKIKIIKVLVASLLSYLIALSVSSHFVFENLLVSALFKGVVIMTCYMALIILLGLKNDLSVMVKNR